MNELVVEACKDLTAALEKVYNLDEKSGDNSEWMFYFGLYARLISSALIDGDRIDTARFMMGKSGRENAALYNWDACLKRLTEYLGGFPADSPIQKARREFSIAAEAAAGNPSGIYRLDMPTGGGKTLAGLRFAVSHARKHHKSRIIYTAPLLSILDQNAAVIREAVQDDTAILEHHTDIIKGDFDAAELNRYEMLSENWDSPFVITTMVQFLNTIFGSQSTQVRRFHALSNSIIIIDEVQAVPSKILSLFSLILNFLAESCNATIVLCSATQPPFADNVLAHSLIREPKNILPEEMRSRWAPVFQRTELIDRGAWHLRDIPSFAAKLLDDYNSVLVVCNKKSEAETIFTELEGGYRKFHLSASMYTAHRKRVLKNIYQALNEGEKIICASTQVIEAGVDISFDTGIRFTAGLDNIVQSAGRCNRNGENGISPVYIISCIEERLIGLKEIKTSQDAANVLLNAFRQEQDRFQKNLAGEEAVAFYYRQLITSFNQGHTECTLKENTTLLDLLSENNVFYSRGKGHDYLLSQAFLTAGRLFSVFDTNQSTVIVPLEEGAALCERLKDADKMEIDELRSLLEQLKPYTISIFDYQRAKLEEWNGLHSYLDGKVTVLDPAYYSDELGLTMKQEVEDCSILIL